MLLSSQLPSAEGKSVNKKQLWLELTNDGAYLVDHSEETC